MPQTKYTALRKRKCTKINNLLRASISFYEYFPEGAQPSLERDRNLKKINSAINPQHFSSIIPENEELFLHRSSRN